MTAEQFTFWLQGFAELNYGEPPNREQWNSIIEHLQTVFVKITPPIVKPLDQKYCNFNQESSFKDIFHNINLDGIIVSG